MLTLEMLLRAMGKETLCIFRKGKPLHYTTVGIPGVGEQCKNSTLYIGKFCELTEEIANNPCVGYVVLPDSHEMTSPNEKERILCEYVIWDKSMERRKLMGELQNCFVQDVRCSKIKHALYHCIRQKEDIQFFVQRARLVVDAPMLVMDIFLNPIALDITLSERKKLGIEPSGDDRQNLSSLILKMNQSSEFMSAVNDSPQTFQGCFLTKDGSKCEFLVKRTESHTGEILGYIIVFHTSRSLQKTDILIMNVLGKSLSMLVENALGEPSKIYCREQLLVALLTDKIENAKIDNSQISLKFPYYRLAYVPTTSKSEAILAWNTIYTEICASEPNFISVFVETDIYIMMGFQCEKEGEILFDQLSKKLTTLGYCTGISGVFQSLKDLRSNAKQAKTAAALGTKYLQDSICYPYSKVFFFDILQHCPRDELRLIYESSPHFLLSEWDNQHGTQYCETLYHYIFCRGNANKTAQLLKIHRNTLIFRLNRIKEICGSDYTMYQLAIFDYLEKYLSDR